MAFYQQDDQRFGVGDAFARAFSDENVLKEMGQQVAQQNPFTQQQALQAIAPQNQFGAPQMPQQGMQQPPQMGAQQGGLNAFLNSPGMAMAAQGMNNMSALRRNQVPNMNPIQAYQQSARQAEIMKNQQLQQMRRDKLVQIQEERLAAKEARDQEKFEIDKDPAYAFDQLRERGLIPNDMSFIDFSTKFGSGGLPSSIQEWNIYNAMNPDDQKRFLEMKRSGQLFSGAGGTTRLLGPGGSSELVGDDAETISASAAAAARTKAFETALGTNEADRHINAGKAIDGINETFAVIEQIDPAKFGGIYGSNKGILPVLGQESVDTWTKIEQLTGRLTFAEREKLKGQGTITDDESEALGRSVQILGQRRISPALARRELENVVRILGDRQALFSGYLIDDKNSYNPGSSGGAVSDDDDPEVDF